MNQRAFQRRLRARFNISASGRPKLRKGELLVFSGRRRPPLELTSFTHIELTDTDGHFGAEVIATAGTCEIIHILEKGKYFDWVCWSDHHQLYALEYLEDPDEAEATFRHLGIDREKYRRMSKAARIGAMPFVAHRLARNLEEFYRGIAVISKLDFDEALSPSPKRSGQAGKLRLAGEVVGSSLYLESKKENKFFQLSADERGLNVVSGTRGKPGRRQFKAHPSLNAALAEAEVILEKKLASGFRRVKVE